MKYLNKIYWSAALVATFFSCSDDFGDTNVDPRAVTINSIPAALTALESKTYDTGYNEYTFLNNEILYPETELATKIKNIGVDPLERSSDGIWNDYYKFLAQANELETLFNNYVGDPEAVDDIRAVKDVLIATKTLYVTSLFGSMPYSEAGKAFLADGSRVFRPAYDSEEAIFMDNIANLQAALQTLSTDVTSSGEPKIGISSNDFILGGSKSKWIKFSNSILLRYATRLYHKNPTMMGGIIKDMIDSGAPLITEGEDVDLVPINLGQTNRITNTYRAAGSAGIRMGETVWNLLSSDTSDLSGDSIIDYRAYIFYDQNLNNEWQPAPTWNNVEISDVGDVYHNRRRNNPNNQNSNYASVNINLLFEDSYRPEIILTASEVQFMLAEVYANGWGVSKDWAMAETHYKKGIESSLRYWAAIGQDIVEWNEASGRPSPITADDVSLLLENDKVKFLDTDSETEKLEKLYAQFWMGYFWQPAEAYFLMRRTEMTPKSGATYNDTFNRITYPESEKQNNSANYQAAVSEFGSDTSTRKLWWME